MVSSRSATSATLLHLTRRPLIVWTRLTRGASASELGFPNAICLSFRFKGLRGFYFTDENESGPTPIMTYNGLVMIQDFQTQPRLRCGPRRRGRYGAPYRPPRSGSGRRGGQSPGCGRFASPDSWSGHHGSSPNRCTGPYKG